MSKMNLTEQPFGIATFRNGKRTQYYFKTGWREPGTVSVRIEHGIWVCYSLDGTNLETDGMQVGSQWDIVEWEPLDIRADMPPPEWCMHCGNGFGL